MVLGEKGIPGGGKRVLMTDPRYTVAGDWWTAGDPWIDLDDDAGGNFDNGEDVAACFCLEMEVWFNAGR